MNITTISITLRELISFGNHSNVCPEVHLTATLDPLNPADVAQDALALLRDRVTEQLHAIVDDELEANGESPRFYRGPLYLRLTWEIADVDVILPAAFMRADLPPGPWRTRTEPMRLDTLLYEESTRPRFTWDCHDDQHLIRDYWSTRCWYVARRLSRPDPLDDVILIVPYGLELPRVRTWQIGGDLSNRPREIDPLLDQLRRRDTDLDLEIAHCETAEDILALLPAAPEQPPEASAPCTPNEPGPGDDVDTEDGSDDTDYEDLDDDDREINPIARAHF